MGRAARQFGGAGRAGGQVPRADRRPRPGALWLREQQRHLRGAGQQQPEHAVERRGRGRHLPGPEPGLHGLSRHAAPRTRRHHGARVQPFAAVRVRRPERRQRAGRQLLGGRRDLDGGRGPGRRQRQLQLPVPRLRVLDGRAPGGRVRLLAHVPRPDGAVRHQHRRRRRGRDAGVLGADEPQRGRHARRDAARPRQEGQLARGRLSRLRHRGEVQRPLRRGLRAALLLRGGSGLRRLRRRRQPATERRDPEAGRRACDRKLVLGRGRGQLRAQLGGPPGARAPTT